nr:hypothetical protein [Microbacterium lacticum]
MTSPKRSWQRASSSGLAGAAPQIAKRRLEASTGASSGRAARRAKTAGTAEK